MTCCTCWYVKAVMSPDTPIFNTDSCQKHIVNMYEWNLYEQSNVIGKSSYMYCTGCLWI